VASAGTPDLTPHGDELVFNARIRCKRDKIKRTTKRKHRKKGETRRALEEERLKQKTQAFRNSYELTPDRIRKIKCTPREKGKKLNARQAGKEKN